MKHQRQFDHRSRAALNTQTLVEDIERVVQILDSEIADAEEKAGVFFVSEAEYPMLARTLAGRRDNLRETVAVLKQRLSDLPANPAHA